MADSSENNGNNDQNPEEVQAEEEDTFASIDQKEQKESRHKGGRVLLGIGIALVAVAAVGGLAFALFVGNEGEEEPEAPVTVAISEPESETIEEEEEEESPYVYPDDGYLGYWNRSGHTDEELTISEINEVYVTINLWWKDLFEAGDVRAYFASDNVASFSCDKDNVILTGKLYFTKDSEQVRDNIMLEITRSDVEAIPTGTMTFTQQHEEAWYEPVEEFTYEDTLNEEYWEEGDLILPESATKLLTAEDIANLSLEEVQYAIAELYARHQCKFDDAALQEYFDSKWWYEGYVEQKDFNEEVFNDVEAANIALLMQREQQLQNSQADPNAQSQTDGTAQPQAGVAAQP